jgi:integrase
MTVRTVTRRGKRKFVIDLLYRNSDGSLARFRRDSAAATITAAREEDRQTRDRIARTGSPYEEPVKDETVVVVTYGQVVERYRRTYLKTDLKSTTRRGYEDILDRYLLPKLKDRPVSDITGLVMRELDFALAKEVVRRNKTRAKSTRNNVQIVLRSTLKFAVEEEMLPVMPGGLPSLKQSERTVLEIPTDAEVGLILDKANATQCRVFRLMAYAGLRPNEVRALRWRDVQLREAGGGFITVRLGKSYGEFHTPKTGQREIPIAPPLWRDLTRTAKRPSEACVALTQAGKPWGQFGLSHSFDRAKEAAGLSGWSVYCLRHYAITSWLRAGVPVHVVQRMAGHSNLSTTQRYVHFLKGDLEMAARLIGNILVTPSEAAQ